MQHLSMFLSVYGIDSNQFGIDSESLESIPYSEVHLHKLVSVYGVDSNASESTPNCQGMESKSWISTEKL